MKEGDKNEKMNIILIGIVIVGIGVIITTTGTKIIGIGCNKVKIDIYKLILSILEDLKKKRELYKQMEEEEKKKKDRPDEEGPGHKWPGAIEDGEHWKSEEALKRDREREREKKWE